METHSIENYLQLHFSVALIAVPYCKETKQLGEMDSLSGSKFAPLQLLFEEHIMVSVD